MRTIFKSAVSAAAITLMCLCGCSRQKHVHVTPKAESQEVSKAGKELSEKPASTVPPAAALAQMPVASGPAHPQLEPLNRFAGRWTVENQIKTDDGKETQVSGEMVGEWILGGTYLRVLNIANGKVDALQLGTYDPFEKCFRWWMFLSQGGYVDLKGDFDAAAKVFKWKGTFSGIATYEDTDTFPDADTFTFENVLKFNIEWPGVRVIGTAKRKK